MIKVYALIKKRKDFYYDYEFDEVIYVGQTKDLKRRLREHKSKEFDSYKVLCECENIKEAKENENIYIKHFDPIFNKSLNFIGKYGTIKTLIKEFKECGYKINEENICEIMDFAIRGRLKPLFSNKYSENDFFKILRTWDNWKQFGRDTTK